MSASEEDESVHGLDDAARWHELIRADLRAREERRSLNKTVDAHDDSADDANGALPVLSEKVEDDENHSVWSWDKASTHDDELLQPHPLPVRSLGLSRRAGWSSYNDYDVITVHGARDDQQTAWTACEDGSDWIENILFTNLSIRQLDYVYDIGNTARIYDPSGDGITAEANALLKELSQNRANLSDTENHRPIIWICHDLGGSIVKKALINAIHNQPEPESQDDPDYSSHIRSICKRLPLLTTSMKIFLACPHGNETQDDLQDQILTLFNLPGPPMNSQMLRKVANLSRQIESINLEFLETKVLNHAVIVNITTAAANSVLETVQPSTGNHQVERLTNESQRTPTHLFSMIDSALLPNLGFQCHAVLRGTDHLGLVRGLGPLESFDWTSKLSQRFNEWHGFNLKKRYSYLAYQNSLLSLSPPTRVNKYDFTPERLRHPPVISWILEQNSVVRQLSREYDSRLLYLHAGRSCSQAVNINLVSQQLHTAYDVQVGAKTELDWRPDNSCFYFEFNKHDSRRASIKDMIVSFMSLFAGRFWNRNDDHYLMSSADYLWRFRSWSLRHLINVFLELQKADSMNSLTILLGGFDSCEKKERSIFIQAILDRLDRSEVWFRLIITTNEPDEFIYDVLPRSNIISLEDCPLSLEDYLAFPGQVVTQDRIKRLLARRPEFTHAGRELSQIFGKFGAVPDLQEKVYEWLTNYNCGSHNGEVTNMLRKAVWSPHQELVNETMDQLSVSERGIMTHIYDWIKYSAEPLTSEILVESIRYTLPRGMTHLQRNSNCPEVSNFLEKVMGGIILRDGRDLKFSDDAFYSASAITGSDREQDQVHRSHASMATACLRYLLGAEGQEMLTSLSVEKQGMDGLSWSPITLPRHSLVSYALRFWAVHYREAGCYRPIDLATELLRYGPKRSAWAEAVYVASNPFTRTERDYISSLPYMAMLGLDDLVRQQLDSEEEQHSLEHDHWLAIAEASLNGHGSTVTLLLEYTGMDDAGLRDALHCAARYGEGEALDCLISKAQQLKHFTWPSSILAEAVVVGLDNLVLALLQADHDLNDAGYDYRLDEEDSATGRDWRAVHIAIEFAQDKCLQILLDSGRVDLGLENNNGQSPLTLATELGTAASIRYLLDAGESLEDYGDPQDFLLSTICSANPKALEVLIDAKVYSTLLTAHIYGENGQSIVPLLLAAQGGLGECTRILLDGGVDPNVASEDGSGSALYHAVDEAEQITACRILLEKGADPNESTIERTDEREMILTRAIGTGNKSLVEMLIDHGAEINVPDPSRDIYDTPLCYAIWNDDYEIMELLLERGADPNLFSRDKPNSFPPLFSATYLGRNVRFIETLIKYNANIHWTRSDGWSVLHTAYDSADTLSLLLERGAAINATKDDGRTTLMLAAEHKMKESVQVLLKQRDPRACLELVTKDDLKATALHHACERYDGDILRMLVEAGADVDSQRSDGEFPLSLLLGSDEKGCEDSVALILKRRPNLNLLDVAGQTLLHKIRSNTPLSVVMRLVEEGAPVNTADNYDQTPLLGAVARKNLDVARYLTTVKGVQCNAYRPRRGSILHVAAQWSLEMVKQLVRTGAEHTVTDARHDETVLYSAIWNQDRNERRKIIRYLVEELGVDVNAPGGHLVYPLVQAMHFAHENSLVKYLLRHGARPDQADSYGRTAIHWAAILGDLDLLKAFAESGADLSVADNFGRTPLHAAAAGRNIRLLKYICEKLPQDVDNIKIVDMDGWTPLMWACKSSDSSAGRIALFLIDEYKADAHVRSKDGAWSPLKLAAFHFTDQADIEDVAKRVENQYAEESRVFQDRSQDRGTEDGPDCDSCFTACFGPTVVCPEDRFYLCFKCSPHRESMHDAEHTFMDIYEWRRRGCPRDPDAGMSDNGDESGAGSENEETDSENEEEEEEEEEEDTD